MDILTILAVLSLLIFTLYVGVMVKRIKGIPKSISDTYYSLDNKVLFGLCMIIPSLILLPKALERSSENSQFLIFLTIVGMCVLAVYPNFKGAERIGHIAGASIALVCSQIWMAYNSPVYILCWFGVATLSFNVIANNANQNVFITLSKYNVLFWTEITALITVYLTCML